MFLRNVQDKIGRNIKMKEKRISEKLKYAIPFLVFTLIFGFALACGGSPEKAIEETRKEIYNGAKEDILGVEEAKVTVENVKSEGNYISLGESVEYDGLKVSVIDCIAMDSYESGYIEPVYPKEGAKFIWICVRAENIGKQEKWLPDCDDFSLLYIDSLISFEGSFFGSPSSVNKEGYTSESVMPGVSREGWILYEVPKDAKAEDILIAWECDYDKYFYWEVPEPLKEAKEKPKAEEEEQAKEQEVERTIRIGDIISEIEGYEGLSVTFLSWVERDIAVEGPYCGDTYYSFNAKPGMKFIIIVFEFKNNGVREITTPHIDSGEITTDKGYFYSVWSSPNGIYSEEYSPRESYEEEVKMFIGNSGGFEKLLPEESVKGCVMFEIPEDEVPLKANLEYIPFPIRLSQ